MPNALYYRQALQQNGTEAVPLPGTGSAATIQNNAAAILQNGGGSLSVPESPVTQIVPSPGAGGSQSEVSQPMANTATVQTAANPGLGSGLMDWVKANPLPAVGIAVAGYFLVKELLKPGK